MITDELVDGVEVYGFIEPGTADDHVVTKNQLAVFTKGSIHGGPPEREGGLKRMNSRRRFTAVLGCRGKVNWVNQKSACTFERG